LFKVEYARDVYDSRVFRSTQIVNVKYLLDIKYLLFVYVCLFRLEKLSKAIFSIKFSIYKKTNLFCCKHELSYFTTVYIFKFHELSYRDIGNKWMNKFYLLCKNRIYDLRKVLEIFNRKFETSDKERTHNYFHNQMYKKKIQV